MKNITFFFLLFLLVGLSFSLGLYTDYVFNEEEDFTIGLYSDDFCGYDGNWIHIKVEEGSNFRRLVEVCNHESGHELFCRLNNGTDCFTDFTENYAAVCENYPRLCLNDEI